MVISGGTGHAVRADRRRRAGRHRQERGERLCRALEPAAWARSSSPSSSSCPRASCPARCGWCAGRCAVRRRPGACRQAETGDDRARRARPREILRRPARHRRRDARRRARRAAAHHRPQRRRQDHALQPHRRRAARPMRGSIALFGRDFTRAAEPAPRPSRPRPHLSDHHALSARHAAAQRHAVAAGRRSPLRWNPFLAAGAPATRCSSGAEAALERVGLAPSRAPRRSPRPPMASGAASRSPWRWRRTRKCCCSTSPSPACRSRSAATCCSSSSPFPRDVTIVMIEHDMDVALDFAERITVMHFGEVVVEGSRAEVVADPRIAGDLSWRVTRWRSPTIDAFYGDSHVLHGVSLRLGEGRLLGLLGRNGAGKTTCMNVTVGCCRRARGAVEVFGADVTGRAPEDDRGRGRGAGAAGPPHLPQPHGAREPDRRGARAASGRGARALDARARVQPPFRGSASASSRWRAISPAASSRCLPSAARSCRIRACC